MLNGIYNFFIMKLSESLLSTLMIIVLLWQRGWGVCPYNWVEFSDMCYMLGKTPDNYEAAKRACALDSQGRLASIKTNQTAYDITNAISYQGSVSEVWSRYALEKEGNDVVVVDDGVKVDDCVGCMYLINEFTAERSCIAIGQISAVSANWTLVNCNSTYSYICETFTVPQTVLKAEEYAAIGCGTFLAVSFVIVVVVDFIKNPATVAPKDTQPIVP